MIFTYKDKLYAVEAGINPAPAIKMKQQDGTWAECVVYKPVIEWTNTENDQVVHQKLEDTVYVREREDFLAKFEDTNPAQKGEADEAVSN